MIRVGTRGSALALTQARWVAAKLREAELVEITTSGDRGEQSQDKARWTSELERALLAGEIDIAVHSAKDVPGELAPGTMIVAVPEREPSSDVICGAATLEELAAGARVGTSSVRRAAQVRALRGDLELVELRGNVDTRLRKLAEGQADALILAAAGLRRLGRAAAIGGVLDALVPAPGQGALLVQGREADADHDAAGAVSVRERIGNSGALTLTAERALARALNASCETPIGAVADRPTRSDGTELPPTHVRLRAWLGLPDGSRWIADELIGPADEVGLEVAERMLSAGARDLIERSREMMRR